MMIENIPSDTNPQMYCRFECGLEDRMSQNIPLGCTFVQLTYDSLRVGPDGRTVATFLNGEWIPCGAFRREHDLGPYWWSDIIVWGDLA